jgi:hypothetical protein
VWFVLFFFFGIDVFGIAFFSFRRATLQQQPT